MGVDKYRTRHLAENPLQYAERDVTELAAVLKDQGFEVRTLTGNQATKQAIDAAIGGAAEGARRRTWWCWGSPVMGCR